MESVIIIKSSPNHFCILATSGNFPFIVIWHSHSSIFQSKSLKSLLPHRPFSVVSAFLSSSSLQIVHSNFFGYFNIIFSQKMSKASQSFNFKHLLTSIKGEHNPWWGNVRNLITWHWNLCLVDCCYLMRKRNKCTLIYGP